MAKDLRSYLQEVKKEGSGYYLEIPKEVSSHLETCVLQQQLGNNDQFPVMFFNKIKDCGMPLVTNTFASYDLLGLAFGMSPGKCDKKSILTEYQTRGKNLIKPVEVAKSEAPVKDVVWLGDDIDLNKLPIPQHAEGDAGKYVTAGFTICVDPDTNIPNAGWYRYQVKGRDEISEMINPNNHGKYIARRYKELGKTMEVALVIGHHPAVVLGSCERGSIDMNELEVMGGLIGEPLRMVKGETIDLMVPADAEIVIEGIVDPTVEVGDGPFAEFAHYYGREMPAYLIKVTAITMRKDAIFYDLDPAHLEHNLSGVLSFESALLNAVKAKVPSVTGLHLPPSGCCLFHTYISIKKRVQGEGLLTGLAALSSETMAKMAIVVDDDIDIYNERDVMWAVATRVQGDKDITIIPNVCGSHLDPLSYDESRLGKGSMTTKVIIDATKPVDKEFSERVRPSAELMKRLNIKDFL